MNHDIKLLAMDFDGVIADSVMECAVVGYNGFAIHNGLSEFILSPNDINPFQLSVFITVRPYIRTGEDYIYIFHAINEHVEIDNQADFDEFKNKYIGLKDSYYNSFYSARKQLLNDHYTEWMSLNPLFWGMDRFLNRNSDKVRIISTKASKFISSILSHYNIKISQRNIYSTENGQTKADILLGILNKEKVFSKDTVFIDDHLDTLLTMQVTNCYCLLATWGYNNNEQQELAEKTNIELVNLDLFYKKYDMR
jgi:phosphoglycolate phosphatase-like HAD superfamily hydrolase